MEQCLRINDRTRIRISTNGAICNGLYRREDTQQGHNGFRYIISVNKILQQLSLQVIFKANRKYINSNRIMRA